MNSDAALQLLLRALPAILVFVLGFLAANDAKTRRQWTQFLYQTGSLRSDQRDDEHKQKQVKWPFFIVALALLWWPFTYYRLATRRFEVTAESDLFRKKTVAPTPAPAVTPKPTPTGPTPPPPPAAPGQENSAPAAPQNAPAAVPGATPKPGGFHL
ncbi:MAG TPA: hypothetical protein VF681_03785 [Abditibacteriaceae bacterium]|jgi:cell division septation protein DedD